MGIKLLGPLTVDGSGRLGPHDRVVLQALATRLGQPVSADELIDAVWGDRPPASAAKNLQSCIVRLRKILGSEAIETSPHGYVLAVPPDHLDARAFEAQVTRARELLVAGENDRVAYLLEQALDTWRGPAFPDLPDWPPARRAAARLDELRLEAQEMQVDALLRSGRAREVLAQAHTLVRAAPLRERRWELLVLAQYQTGAQAEALRSLRQLRAVLARELGIDPSPEMLALEQSILQQDPRLLVPEPRAKAAQCPWQGLKAYDVDDTDRFFGRDRDISSCLELLETGSFAALVGPSGSGKSSIMRAGVLAGLRQRGHAIVLITPGRRPLDALTALPDDADGRTVLAIDQTEEVFALCDDPDERRDFFDRLTQESARRPVILTLRGDRLSQVTEHPGFSRLVERGLHLVGALDEEALREAVTGPAAQAGLVLQPGLVDLLVREVRDDPGALPLLSHALQETWRRREGNTLTVDGYHASGGIHGAVAQSAEQLYGSVDPGQRHLLRDLLLRLVSPGVDGEAVRTQVPRRLVASDTHHEELIGMLVDARLVTSDEGVLEITHEALARAWPRLRGWLDDDVEGQRIRHHLSGAADAWDTLGRPDSELYRGVRLTRALDWQSRTESTLTGTEREFLGASREASDAEERSAAEHARAQTRLIRRLRIVLGGAAVLLVLALAAGGIAAVQSDPASDNAAVAASAEVRAVARRAGASALVADDIDTSLLLGVAAARMDESPQTLRSLVGVLNRQPSLVASVPLAGADPRALDLHPDGELVAAMDTNHRVRLLKLESGRQIAEWQAGPPQSEAEESRPMRFSPDGQLLGVARTALQRRPLALLDATTLLPTDVQPGGIGPGRWQTIGLAFSQDGASMVAVLNRMVRSGEQWVTRSTTAYVWSVADPAEPRATVDLSNIDGWASAALSPDGHLLYSAAPDLRVHRLASGRSRLLATEAEATFGDVDVSPDGAVLAHGRGSEGETLLRDARTGKLLHSLTLPGEQGAIRFSDDGRRVLTVLNQDRDSAVWSVRTGRQVFRVHLSQGGSGAVDLDATGRTVVSAAVDGAVRSWDADYDRRYLQRQAVPELPWRDAQGACLVTPSATGTKITYYVCGPGFGLERILLLDTESQDITVIPFDSGVQVGVMGSWDPAGDRYASVIGDAVMVWNEHGGRVARREIDPDTIDAQFDLSGERLVLSGTDGAVGLVDATTLEPTGEPVRLGGTAWAVGGPDGLAFAIVGGTDAAYFWRNDAQRWALVDLDNGQVVATGALDLGFVNAIAYSPRGRHAAIAAERGVQVIDLEAGRPVREAQLVHKGTGWVSFSPDGRRLVTSGFDGDVALWDVATATVIARTGLTRSTLVSPTFTADSSSVVLAPWWYDPAVYLWDPSREHAVETACWAAGRDLTPSEWSEHFGDLPFRETCPQ